MLGDMTMSHFKVVAAPCHSCTSLHGAVLSSESLVDDWNDTVRA